MNKKLLSLYHRSPAWLRQAAATARGLQLRAWRYGPETERLIAEAHEREGWDAARWREWQGERLAYILNRAATRVPYYREHWSERRRRGDLSSREDLKNWPVIEKDALRANPLAFVADDCDVRRMFHDHTSGTTGKSLDLWLGRETVRRWYALSEARWREWYGVTRRDRWAILGGQMVAPATVRRPPFWVWNAGLKQLYMSSYHLAPDLVPHYLEALKRYRVKYLLGYTSSLYALAREILKLKWHDLRMEVVVTNAEPVFKHQRETIAEAFECPVRETYGMAETVAAASECEAGRLHLWPDAGICELLTNGAPTPRGRAGELISTGLLNADMPLIRYQVGDRATLPLEESTCACGRTLPTLLSVDGRVQDTLYTMDGRSIGCIDTVYGPEVPLREAQIIQESLSQVRVRYVPAPEWTKDAGASLIAGMRERMGAVEVILEEVREVPRTASGKFRPVICNLSPEELRRVEGATG
jgi:phenylacetate-CoA ligase